MANVISGNAVAVNAAIFLRAIFPSGQGDNVIQKVYTDSSGNYSFSNVIAGTYQIQADLAECITAPYSSGYRYLTNLIATMDSAGDNITNLNFTPTLIIATQGTNTQDHSNNLGRNYIVPRN
jgi:hypothetical protein